MATRSPRVFGPWNAACHSRRSRSSQACLTPPSRRGVGGTFRQPGCGRFRGEGSCPRCGEAPHDFAALSGTPYTYVLGDGTIFDGTKQTSLRIFCDAQYQELIAEMAGAIGELRQRPAHIGRHPKCECVVITSYWKSWPCFFPQHGAGRKHNRPILLEPWQQELVEEDPRGLIRGLIQTDGWRGTNKVHVKGRDYEYPRYQFSNRSDDIRRIFTDACDLLEVEWRPWGRWHISVARRDSVARLDEFVGLKA